MTIDMLIDDYRRRPTGYRLAYLVDVLRASGPVRHRGQIWESRADAPARQVLLGTPADDGRFATVGSGGWWVVPFTRFRPDYRSIPMSSAVEVPGHLI